MATTPTTSTTSGSPSAGTASVFVAENLSSTVMSISLLAYDRPISPDAPLHLVGVQAGQNGTVSLTASGDVLFTPTAGYLGAASFSYTVADQSGATAVGQVDVTVTPVVQPASTSPLTFQTVENTSFSVNADQIIGAAYSPIWTTYGGGQLLDHTVNLVNPTNGTASIDQATGAITFTPDPGFTGVAHVNVVWNNVHPGLGQEVFFDVVAPPADPAASSPGTTADPDPAPAIVLSSDGHSATTSAGLAQLTVTPTAGAYVVSDGGATAQMAAGMGTIAAADGHIMVGVNDAAGQPVWWLYHTLLGRLPDLPGFQYWVGQVEGGAGLQQVAGVFMGTAAAQSTYGGTSDTQYLDLLYQNALDRAPDASGLAYWTDQLSHGAGRADVLLTFIAVAEHANTATAAHAGADGYWLL